MLHVNAVEKYEVNSSSEQCGEREAREQSMDGVARVVCGGERSPTAAPVHSSPRCHLSAAAFKPVTGRNGFQRYAASV